MAEKKEITLYEMTGMFKGLMMQAQEIKTEEDIQCFRDTYEALNMAIGDKLEGCCAVLEKLQSQSDILKAEAKWRMDKAKVIDNSIKHLKDYMLNNMKTLDIQKTEAGQWTVSIAKNGGKRKLNVLVPVEKLPKQLTKIETKVDTDAIRKYMQDAGTEQISAPADDPNEMEVLATLEPQGEHLNIR